MAVLSNRRAATAFEEVEVRPGVRPFHMGLMQHQIAGGRALMIGGPGLQSGSQLRLWNVEMQAATATSNSIISPSRTTARGPPAAASGEVCSTTVP